MSLRPIAVALVLCLALPARGAIFNNLPEPHLLDVALGTKVGSLLHKRGATLYDGLWLSPILYVGLFARRVQFFGNSLEYVDFVYRDNVRVRSRVAFTGDRPTIKTGTPFTFRNSRQKSFEWTNSVETFFPNFDEHWVQVDLMVAKDLKAHGGVHGELTVRGTLARLWLRGLRPLAQPQVFATLGWGTARHNEYLYGVGANQSGFNYFSTGLYLTAPDRIDPAFPVIEAAYTRVLGSANRSGTLVADKTDAVGVTITMAVSLFAL